MDFKDYYAALGVARDAGEDDIRKAYRKLARKYHPDVSQEADAEQKMRDVNEARDVLGDPRKRAAYDQLADRVARGGSPDGGFHAPPGWDEGFEFQGSPGGAAGTADFSEFFSSIFGAREGAGGAGGPRAPFRARGEDHHAAIEITLEDALHGAQRQLSLRAQVVDDQGRPRFETRMLDVAIPAGVRPGQFIRLSGQGLPGHGGEPAGDLYLEVRIATHARWRIEGADLYMTLPVTPTEAALGAQVTVPTPTGGRVDVTIPPGARAGMKLRLKDRGLPGKTPGHLYLLIEIALPPADSDAVRAAYQQLAKAAAFEPRAQLLAD
jgi:curved DNA-binding protein